MSAPPWLLVKEQEAAAGESRVNLLRAIALFVFFGQHLLNVILDPVTFPATSPFNRAVTALFFAWMLEVSLLHICLGRRWTPPGLKYAATGSDLLLITILVLVAQQSNTALASLYFLVIASSALRLSLPLVYVATAGAGVGFLLTLWYQKAYLHLPASERLSVPNAVVFILGLLTAGFLAGQMVRQVRRIVEGREGGNS